MYRLLTKGRSISLLTSSCLARLLILGSGLGQTDAVHEVAHTALGDDVGDGVADLDGHHSTGGEASLAVGGSAHHWHDEDDGVGAPREHGCPACPLDLLAASLRLCILGLLEADEEGVHDVGERQHGEEPEGPSSASLARGLTRVAVKDHESRADAEGGATLEGLLLGEAHDEDDLDEEQRDGKEPVDVPVSIVEWDAG